MEKINISNLSIDENLVKFINDEAIPGTNVDVKKFCCELQPDNNWL